MRQLIFLLAAVVLVSASPKWNELESYSFDVYLVDFNKNYVKDSAEYLRRQTLFELKLSEIKTFNAQSATFKKGVNQFSDSTLDELKDQTMGYSKQLKNVGSNRLHFRSLKEDDISEEEIAALPKHVDWRDSHVVTPVKDQGHCGSCWAFSSIAVLESHAAISSGQLKTLSAQQLISCAQNAYSCGGTGGCKGSISEIGYNYAQIFGITSESKYSYSSYQGKAGRCSFDPANQPIEITIDGYMKLPANSYAHLLKAVATIGPMDISVDASKFHDYESGVFSGCDSVSNVDINHAVTLIGYGTDEKEGDYWLVRNSWGTKYGENGYIRVKRESTPTCTTDYTPLDGNACASFSTVNKVCGQCGILSYTSYPIGVKVVG